MKPAGRSLKMFFGSWFNSFKTDLEMYIYITLQEAIYYIDSVCSATALVNIIPEPKPKNCLMAIRICQLPERASLGIAMAASALSFSLSSTIPFSRTVLHLPYPKVPG